MPLLVIIFGILLLLTVIVIAVHTTRNKSHLTSGCSGDEDCPKGDLCIANPEDQNKKQCFPSNQFFCKVQPTTDLMQCICKEFDENGVCTSAKTDCDKCLNNPAFSCIQVSDKHPYSWNQGNSKVKIPNSPDGYGWCLPDIVNRNIVCNPYTSEYVLTEVGNGEYEWGCWCKYPNLFDHSEGPGTLTNCTLPRVCGETSDDTRPFGKLYVPAKDNTKCHATSDCGDGQVCLDVLKPAPCGYDGNSKHIENNDCKDSHTCVCHTEWAGEYTENTDPLTGQCVCEPGLDYQCVVRSTDYFEMNCVKDHCSPWGRAPEGKCNPSQCYSPDKTDCECCNCPSGMIMCPDDVNPNNLSLLEYCKKSGPTCIVDPCSTQEVPGGYWNGTECVCNADGKNPSFVPIADENSAVGWVCKDACEGNGPCGNRGTCYFPEDGKTVADALCCDCHCPFTNDGDNSCTCSATIQNKSGSVAGGDGASCCFDDDCCSGNCEDPDCDPQCDNCKYPPMPKSGTCRGPIHVNSSCSEKKCVIKPPSPPVQCSDGSLCPHATTCCSDGSGGSNCCPYDDGTCCGDNLHCCPQTHPKCDVANGLCKKEDGSDPIPWTGHTGGSK